MELNLLAVGTAALLAMLLGAAWYTAFGTVLARLSPAYAEAGRPPAWTIGAELVRCLVTAVATAILVALTGAVGWERGAGLGLVLWLGFPAVLLTGSVIHENVPWRLAMIHAGDWLLKLVAVTVLLTVWR